MNTIDRILGEARSPEQLRQLFNLPPKDLDTRTKAIQAFMYAKEVIKGRWPEGEAAILRDPGTSVRYARDIIKGRWPEAEAIIATDRGAAAAYAGQVIKGRWPEVEATLLADPEYAESYADQLTRERRPEDLESYLAKSEIMSKKYLEKFSDRKLSWAMKGWIPFGDDVWGI